MVTSARAQVGEALQTLSQQTAAQPETISKSVREWAWDWHLTGNERPDEIDKAAELFDAAQRFASRIIRGQKPSWLLLCGQSGCGKTKLARAIAGIIARYGAWCYNTHVRPEKDPHNENYLSSYAYAQEGAIFTKWAELIDAGRESNFHPFKQASNDHYKVIDDIGAEGFTESRSELRDGARVSVARPSQFVISQLSKLCDFRLGKWTVWTTNFTNKQLGELFDVRIASRMLRDDSIVIDVTGLRDFNVRKRPVTA